MKQYLFIILGGAVAVIIVAIMILLVAGSGPEESGVQRAASPVTSTPVAQPHYTAPAQTAAPSLPAAPNQPRVDESMLRTSAILSLRNARVNGDSRSPPMSPPPATTPPTQAQKDDPTLFAEYEHSQKMKFFQSYVDAVPKKVKTLQDALDKAAQPGSGITQQQMQQARDKIAGLEAMQQKLLRENPELQNPSAKPNQGQGSATNSSTSSTATNTGSTGQTALSP
jgi:hypothetical protein